MVKSLAGSGREYVEIQGRMRDGALHIQGGDTNLAVNRDYGVAVDVNVPAKFETWLGEQEHTLESWAGTGNAYVPMQVADRGDDIHVQVGGTKYNRPYGAAFNVVGEVATLLGKFVSNVLGGPERPSFDDEDDETTPVGTAIF